jgi:hypothetical protein
MTRQMHRKPRYFLCHLTEEARAPNYLRKETLPPLSIELRAPRGGLSGKHAYLDFDTTELEIDGHRVPTKVIQAAKSLVVGDGGWFDEEGERAGFF